MDFLWKYLNVSSNLVENEDYFRFRNSLELDDDIGLEETEAV